MDRLDIAIYLINDAKKEKERLSLVKQKVEEAEEKAKIAKDKGMSNCWWYDYYEFKNNEPKKNKIKENLKIARRLLMEEFKEVNRYE